MYFAALAIVLSIGLGIVIGRWGAADKAPPLA